MKRAYYYLFYKFYKLAESSPSRWLSDWKAGVCIIALELFLISSIANYFVFFVDKSLHLAELSNWGLIICVLAVVTPNYIAFLHTDTWKDYVMEFDRLPKKKNRIGGWIILGVVLFVIINFIFSFYLYYQT